MDAANPRLAMVAVFLFFLNPLESSAAGHSIVAGTTTLGSSARSENFIVSADSSAFAQQVAQFAEKYRHDLAISWLGHDLSRWAEPCPIHVSTGPRLGAGGATSFSFADGQPRGWHMEIQGSRQRVLDSVLPHEITHTILATHFGRPLPRWADEGAATSVEHVSERSKQEQLLVRFLTTDRGIAFNQMFAMTEYPRDILPLYSQGYSLARFLIAQHGRRAYVRYLADGMNTNNWTAATRKHYGYDSLGDLQNTWLSWVRGGSRDQSPVQLAAFTRSSAPQAGGGSVSATAAADVGDRSSAPTGSVARASATADTRSSSLVTPDTWRTASDLVPLPRQVASLGARLPAGRSAAAHVVAVAANPSDTSWYDRRRSAAQTNRSSNASTSYQSSRPQSPQSAGQIILQSDLPGRIIR